MTEYRPIDCDQHSVLELLAMRRTPVTLDSESGDGEIERCGGTIVDVLTHDRAEFLVVLDAHGQRTEYRLDRIRLIRGEDGDLLWRQNIDVDR